MAASTAPPTASKMITIGDLGGFGEMSVIGPSARRAQKDSQILLSNSDAVTVANATRNAVIKSWIIAAGQHGWACRAPTGASGWRWWGLGCREWTDPVLRKTVGRRCRVLEAVMLLVAIGDATDPISGHRPVISSGNVTDGDLRLKTDNAPCSIASRGMCSNH